MADFGLDKKVSKPLILRFVGIFPGGSACLRNREHDAPHPGERWPLGISHWHFIGHCSLVIVDSGSSGNIHLCGMCRIFP